MNKIIVTHLKTGGVTASLEGHPGVFTCSPDHQMAIGMLIIPMQEEFGITIEHRHEGEKEN